MKYGLWKPPARRFAQPTKNDVTLVNPVLTNLSIGLKNERFFWDQIAPVSEQPMPTGTIPIYTEDFWFRRQSGGVRAPEGPYTRVGYGVESDTYATIEHGFEKTLGDVVKNANQFPENLENIDVAFLTNLMEIELEKEAAAAYFVTSVWGTTRTLTGTDQWSDFDGSDPIADAQLAKRIVRQATGQNPNKGFVGLLGWEKLQEHPLLVDKIKHTQEGIVTEAIAARALGLDEIVVGDSVENTSAEGQAFNGADIWTDNMLFAINKPSGLFTPSGGTTFMWNEIGNIPWALQQYREEQTRALVNRILSHWDMKIVSAPSGYILLDLVA